MLEADHQLREPDRNELFARAARAIGEADEIVSGRFGGYDIRAARSAQIKTVEALQQILMLVVKIERTTDNLVRSRIG